MSSEPWTIDSIAHALPHPELRATFMREASFTDVRELPAIFERWVRFIRDWEAGNAHVEELRSYIRQHGQLPDGYDAETSESRAQYEELKARMEALRRQGHNAA